MLQLETVEGRFEFAFKCYASRWLLWGVRAAEGACAWTCFLRKACEIFVQIFADFSQIFRLLREPFELCLRPPLLIDEFHSFIKEVFDPKLFQNTTAIKSAFVKKNGLFLGTGTQIFGEQKWDFQFKPSVDNRSPLFNSEEWWFLFTWCRCVWSIKIKMVPLTSNVIHSSIPCSSTYSQENESILLLQLGGIKLQFHSSTVRSGVEFQWLNSNATFHIKKFSKSADQKKQFVQPKASVVFVQTVCSPQGQDSENRG